MNNPAPLPPVAAQHTPDLESLVTDLLETRDLCGDEAETLRQWQSDYGKLTASQIMSARGMVETLWRKSQAEAGVRLPLSSEERAKAHRDINSGGK